MSKEFFIGVDGGATKSVIRLEDENRNLLAQEVSGPANIRISEQLAWNAIQNALEKIFHSLQIPLDDETISFHAGMGVAGCEIHSAYQTFINHPHFFHTLVVSSDSHVACLGAHSGRDGAVIIAGTGVVGFQMEAGQSIKIGGWGFPHDDDGGGAWLGLQAVKVTLQWLDGRMPISGVAQEVFDHFGEDHYGLVHWSNMANSSTFAELAPIVIQQSTKGDTVAINLLKKAAQHIDLLGQTLLSQQLKTEDDKPLPCVLLGGVAPFIRPFLKNNLTARLRPSELTPDAGAILLIRNHLAQKNLHLTQSF